MQLSLLLSLLLLLLNGCASVVDAVSKTAQVLADPSVPVGASVAQPTQISLSLHATATVNPNPYQEPSVQPIPSDSDSQSAAANSTAAWNTIDPALVEPFSSTDTVPPDILEVPIAPVHNINLVSETDPPPLTAAEQIANALAAAKPATDPDESAIDSEATPIAFKVIQLKDHSLLLQADFESLFADTAKALGTTYLGHDDYVLLPDEFSYVAPTAVAEHTRYIGVTAAYNDADAATWKALIKIQPEGHTYAVFVKLDQHTVHLKKQEQ